MPKSTLADKMKGWCICQDYAMVVVERAKVLYKDEHKTIINQNLEDDRQLSL